MYLGWMYLAWINVYLAWMYLAWMYLAWMYLAWIVYLAWLNVYLAWMVFLESANLITLPNVLVSPEMPLEVVASHLSSTYVAFHHEIPVFLLIFWHFSKKYDVALEQFALRRPFDYFLINKLKSL